MAGAGEARRPSLKRFPIRCNAPSILPRASSAVSSPLEQGACRPGVISVMRKWLGGLEARHVIGAVEDLWMFGRWIAAALGLAGVSLFVLK